jgi:hypothetical protein
MRWFPNLHEFRTISALRTRVSNALRPLVDPNTLRGCAPGIVALALFPFLAVLIRLELNESLFGDTLVFQYTGWCIRHGMKLYRDIGTADGPFIDYLQAAIQNAVGLEDRSFRKADLFLHVTCAAAMGALIAPNLRLPPAGRIAQRLAWAALVSSIWLSWYLTLDWTITTERETFYTLFASLGTILVYVSPNYEARAARIFTFLGGFVVTTQIFGKPTGVVYVLMGGLIAVLTDAKAMAPRRGSVRMFAAGAGTCVACVLLALAASGSIPGYFFWCVKIPYYGNRFLFGIEWLPLLFSREDQVRAIALTALVTGVAAVASKLLPRRALPLAFTPPLLFLGFCLQARGYNYQAVPAAGASYVVFLAILASLWQGNAESRWAPHRGALATAALVYAASQSLDSIQKSPYHWNGDKNAWTTPKAEFAAAERKVGIFLREHTQPDDRLFVYSAGENAHVVLLTAQRRTVSPFFHSFWLDPIGLLPQSKIQPDTKQLANLEELQTRIRSIACAAVENGHPAAMAFNLLEQVFKVCPNIKSMLETQYQDAIITDGFRIYMRNAAASKESSPGRRVP